MSNKILHVKKAALVEVKQRTYKNRLAVLPFSTVAMNTAFPSSASSLAVPTSLLGTLDPHPQCYHGSLASHCPHTLVQSRHEPWAHFFLLLFRVSGQKNQRDRKATLVI